MDSDREDFLVLRFFFLVVGFDAGMICYYGLIFIGSIR